MLNRTSLTIIILLCLGLSACTTRPPTRITNACSIFTEYPSWYFDSLGAYRQWGLPISVQLAIIKQESHFIADAKPPRTKLFGFIPWSRPTTAYGYSQATNGTWDHYLQSTRQAGQSRDNYADAVDFIGWYSARAHHRLGISQRNTYDLYLAYHEGLGGYSRQSYNAKPWLLRVARKVNAQSKAYRNQLLDCDSPQQRSLWSRVFG